MLFQAHHFSCKHGTKHFFSFLDIIAEKPPKPELGDIGFPMFAFAKQFRLSPAQIASEVAQSEQLLKDENEKRDWPGNLKAVGPYLNVYLERTRAVTFLLSNAANPDWGSSAVFSGRKVKIGRAHV